MSSKKFTPSDVPSSCSHLYFSWGKIGFTIKSEQDTASEVTAASVVVQFKVTDKMLCEYFIEFYQVNDRTVRNLKQH